MVDAERLGGSLAEALLAGDVGDSYRRAMERAESHGHGTRMTLSLADAPALLSVPWEFLYQRPRFLASQRRTPIVRLLETGTMAPAPVIDGAVRILGIVASPRDLAPLDVDGERRRITQALAPGRRGGHGAPRLARAGIAEEPPPGASRRQLPRHPLRRPQRLHRGRVRRHLPRGPRRPVRPSRSTRRCSPTSCPTRTCSASSSSTRARAPARRSPTRTPASPRRSCSSVCRPSWRCSSRSATAPRSCSPRSCTRT